MSRHWSIVGPRFRVKAEKRQEEDKGNVLEAQSDQLEDSLASQQPSCRQQHAEAIISDLEQEVGSSWLNKHGVGECRR